MSKNGTQIETNSSHSLSEQGKLAAPSIKRSISPVFLVGGFVLALSCAFWLIWHNREIENQKALHRYARSVMQDIEARLTRDEEYLAFLSEELAAGKLSSQSFQRYASHYVQDHPGLLSIAWINPERQVEQITDQGDLTEDTALSNDFLRSEKTSHSATKAKCAIYTPVTKNQQGGSVFQVWLTAFHKDTLHGFFVGTYSWNDLLHAVVSPQIQQECSIAFEEFPVVEGKRLENLEGIIKNTKTLMVGESVNAYIPISNQGVCIMFQEREVPISWPIVFISLSVVLFAFVMSWMLVRQGKDLARRKEFELKLLNAKKIAEEASFQKGQFLANMSHEIRTPMTAILGYLELIADSCPRRCEFASAEINGYIDAVQRNGHHLMELINSILDLSKIEAGKIEILRKPCSLNDIISDVVTLTRPVAERKGLSVSAELLTEIPQTIKTDAFRLRQILVNLIGNAVKFTEKGSIHIKAGMPKGLETPYRKLLFLEVEDTGIGIPSDRLYSLFSPFSQADSSTDRKFGGTGLGLTISRMLARMLGGDLTVKSVEGQGSIFTLTIAVDVANGTPMLKELKLCNKKKADPFFKKTLTLHSRILLAEDGIDNQRLISTLLRKVGAKITIADNGQKAVEEALSAMENKIPYDIILMDMQMPILDGYGATRKLRSQGYDGPIIALTANAMNGDRQKCIEAGCDDYLRKPIESDRLYTAILRFSQKERLLELTTDNENGYNGSRS